MTFEEYWETDGSRKQVTSHEERARLAWRACEKSWLVNDEQIANEIVNWQNINPTLIFSERGILHIMNQVRLTQIKPTPNADLCGMSFKNEETK